MVLKNPVTELGLILSLFFLFVCGCNGFFFKSDLDDLELRAPKLEVEGSAGSLLGQHRSLPPQGFEEHLEKLLEEERFYSAQRFVEKYPELVLELLRRSTTLEATSSTLQFIAKVYDSNFVSTSEMGWYALLKDRISNPDAYSAFDQSHQKQLSLLERGYFKELAQADSLLSHVPPAGKMLQLEALYLKAIALFLDNQNDEAAQTFEKGVQLAQNYDPFQVALFSLFRSESLRRKNQEKTAEESWTLALNNTKQLTQARSSVIFVFLWERLLKLKPQNTSWPSNLMASFPKVTPHPLLSQTRPESFLWEQIGRWKMEREEPQNALIAFRQSQNLEMNPLRRSLLEIELCKSLVALSQYTGAINALLPLAQDQNPQIHAPALGLLGLIEIKRENLQRGLGLMLRSLDKGKDAWDGKAETTADLGLGFLLAGIPKEGLKYLHEAQAQFRSKKQYESLLQSLRNEALYLEKVGQKNKKFKTLQEEIETIERSLTL